MPNIITASGPGDLFTVRNVGNLVPGDGSTDTSVAAALEFAIGEIGVSSVVVCGHSSCGAMKAMLAGADAGDGKIGSWLGHAIPSLAAYRLGHPAGRAAAEAGFPEVDQLAVVNVAKQVENLMRDAVVGRAAADGRLRVVGLFFDIPTAQVFEVTGTEIRLAGTDARAETLLP